MAKGLRSHSKQQAKSVLRAKVFAPVINARTERLSKKLTEIASQPREEHEGKEMDVDASGESASHASYVPLSSAQL